MEQPHVDRETLDMSLGKISVKL